MAKLFYNKATGVLFLDLWYINGRVPGHVAPCTMQLWGRKRVAIFRAIF